MKKGVLWGIGLALASVMLWGCSRDYIETAVTEAESTRAESTAEIVIVQETKRKIRVFRGSLTFLTGRRRMEWCAATLPVSGFLQKPEIEGRWQL